MKSLRKKELLLLIAILFLTFSGCKAQKVSDKGNIGPDPEYITVFPQKNNSLLFGNPGKGWVKMYWNYEDTISDVSSFDGGEKYGGKGAIIPYISTGYHRLNWSLLEPYENQFNWEYIDKMVSACTSKGFQFAFGIMPENSYDPNPVTPDWVFDIKGATFVKCQVEGTGDTGDKGQKPVKRVPVWSDSVFIAEYKKMIEAVAKRFDGDPRIAFIDIRSYGNYGEWHIAGLGCSKELDNLQQQEMIDIYSVFKSTPLIVVSKDWTATPGDHVQYAVDKYRTGIRNDGMLSSDAAVRQCLYGWDKPGRGPGVGELTGSYTHLKNSGKWDNTVFVNDIKDSRLSYVCLGYWDNDTRAFFQDQKAIADEWLNRMGYYLQLQKVVLPRNMVPVNQNMNITFEIQNNGIACPALKNSCVKLALLNINNNIIEITPPLKNIQPCTWKPDGFITAETAPFSFEKYETGTKVAIGFFSARNLQSPDILIANDHQLEGAKWYILNDMPTEK